MRHKPLASSLVISFCFALTNCNFQPAKKKDTSPTEYSFNIVAFNDFHGAIEENGRRMGLAKVGTYLKEQTSLENTLSISQGDDWQGSIYSNYNRGRLINDVYAYAKLSARTIGNHDFDWGVDALIDNTKTGYDGYTTPVLAANVYDYNFSTKTLGNIQQQDIGQTTVSYTLENGLKVGIVGVIGENQITSITSSYTEEIGFADHIKIIKDESVKLKEAGCDVVIASCHAGQEQVIEQGLEEYVNLVLCGHTHKNESYIEENGLYYLQFGANGECIGNLSLTYNKNEKNLTVDNIEEINMYNIDYRISGIDPVISELISDYAEECDSEANEVLVENVYGNFYRDQQAANMMCKAIYEKAVEEGHDNLLLSYCNIGRTHLYGGTWTYADIYEAFPFDNVIYIESVKGNDILNNVAYYNNVYINPSIEGDIIIDRNQYYKIAVVDYLLYHTNTRRYYDYFASFDGHPDGFLSSNYRLILREWIKKQTSLNYRDYMSTLDSFKRSRLVSE